MVASSVRVAARDLHLARAARSAGEVFAHTAPEERAVQAPVGRLSALTWLFVGMIAAAALAWAL